MYNCTYIALEGIQPLGHWVTSPQFYHYTAGAAASKRFMH